MSIDPKSTPFDIIIEAGQSNASGCGRGGVTNEYIPSDHILYLVRDFTVDEGIKNGIWNIKLEYKKTP